MISITVNGKKREIEGPTGLLKFLEVNKIEPRLIAVEYNGEIVPRNEYSKVTIDDGDRLEIVHMVAGG